MNQIILEDASRILNGISVAELEGKSFLITGASGLIGVYFTACLNQISRQIAGVSVTAVFQSEPQDYLKQLLDFPGASYKLGDLTSPDFVSSLPHADFVIHAAGYGQPLKFMGAPEKTLKLNTLATFLLMDKLNTNGRFLFLSSTEVYSGLKADVYRESDIGTSTPLHPRACYIEGKRAGEAICNAYRAQGIAAMSARLAHTYGPGARLGDQRVLLAFIEKALNGRIDMLDAGKALRTYCYVADAVEIMIKILLYGQEPVYNVSGHSQTSIADLARLIGRLTNVPVSMPDESGAGVAGAPEDVAADTTKSETEFDKSDYTNLEDGLERTINWYRDTYFN